MLGITLTLLAAFAVGVAITMQKYSMKSMGVFSIIGLIKNKNWIHAMLIGIMGMILFVISLSMENLSTVQPLLSAYLLIPIFTGVTFFKEKLGARKWMLIGVLLLGIGLVSFY